MWIPALVSSLGPTVLMLQKLFDIFSEDSHLDHRVSELTFNLKTVLQNQEILINQQKEILLQAQQIEYNKSVADWNINFTYVSIFVGVLAVGISFYYFPSLLEYIWPTKDGNEIVINTVRESTKDILENSAMNHKEILQNMNLNYKDILEKISFNDMKSNDLVTKLANKIILETKDLGNGIHKLILRDNHTNDVGMHIHHPEAIIHFEEI